MSDWFDSEHSETPENGERKRRKPVDDEIGVVRPPRPPHLIDSDRIDKIVDQGYDDWIKREEEMNKRHRSQFGELSDQDLRDEAPDEERSEEARQSPEA